MINSDKSKVLLFSVGVLVLALLFSFLRSPLFLSLYMFIPAVMTVIVLLVSKEGFTKAGWKSLGLFKLGFNQSLLAILIPVLVLPIGYLLVFKLQPASFKPFPGGEIHWLNSLLFIFGMAAFQTVTLSLGEEIGWRGYLLPKAVNTYGRLKAHLFIGMLWAVWHYPLIFIAGEYGTSGNKIFTTLLFTATLIPLSIILGELRLKSKSVWPASIFHSVHNSVWQFLGSMSVGMPIVGYLAGEAGLIPLVLYSLAAFVLFNSNKVNSNKETTGDGTDPLPLFVP